MCIAEWNLRSLLFINMNGLLVFIFVDKSDKSSTARDRVTE